MTDEGHTQLMIVLDNVWGGVDNGREAGYRLVFAEFPDEIVHEAVRRMTREDRTWLPKAPEIAARALVVRRELATAQRVKELQGKLARTLGAGGA